jgi:hypothetical protein
MHTLPIFHFNTSHSAITQLDWISLLAFCKQIYWTFLAVISTMDFHCAHSYLTLFWNIYNFGPEHRKQLLFDILSNPVPGIEFEGRVGKSSDLDSFRRHCFNHNLIARRIARNKHLSAKCVTQSSTVVVHDCPLSNIDASAPKLYGYETYATFHDTSMEHEVSASAQSMPMTLYFAILEFPCPDIVFLTLPRCPPDGFITSSLVLMLISSIFIVTTTCICLWLSLQRIQCIQVTQPALRELYHLVLREAPTRLYFILREYFCHVP